MGEHADSRDIVSSPSPEIDPTGPPWPLRVELIGYDAVGNAGVRDVQRANIGVLIEPHDDRELVLVVVGHKHEMTTTQLGRCWYRTSCTSCGYTYEVDSSD